MTSMSYENPTDDHARMKRMERAMKFWRMLCIAAVFALVAEFVFSAMLIQKSYGLPAMGFFKYFKWW